jgi:hypothetical protein
VIEVLASDNDHVGAQLARKLHRTVGRRRVDDERSRPAVRL